MKKQRARLYDTILTGQIRSHRQMAFATGPRQVGKTTTCRNVGREYLNWDNQDDRNVLLAGPAETARQLGLDRLKKSPAVAVLDELHKYRRWKSFLKGFFDTFPKRHLPYSIHNQHKIRLLGGPFCGATLLESVCNAK